MAGLVSVAIPVLQRGALSRRGARRGAGAGGRPRDRDRDRRLRLDRRLARDRRTPRRDRPHDRHERVLARRDAQHADAARASGPRRVASPRTRRPPRRAGCASLLEGFDQADDVAAVFGPHDPRPDASHMIKSEMERHFAHWGDGGARIDVQRLDRTPGGLAAYREFPGELTFLSDVNCCIARWAWERIPYREVPVRRGPAARARADRGRLREGLPPRRRACSTRTTIRRREFFKRYFDEFRSLREVLGHVQPWGPKTHAVGHPRPRRRRQALARGARACSGLSLVRAAGGLGAPLDDPDGGRDRRHARRPAARRRCAAGCRSRVGRRFVAHDVPAERPARRRTPRSTPPGRGSSSGASTRSGPCASSRARPARPGR